MQNISPIWPLDICKGSTSIRARGTVGGTSSCLVVPCAICRALQSPGESARRGSLAQCCAFVTALCCVCAILRFLSVTLPLSAALCSIPCSSSLGSEAQQVVTGAHGNCEIPKHRASLREGVYLWALVALVQSLSSGTFSSVCGAGSRAGWSGNAMENAGIRSTCSWEC